MFDSYSPFMIRVCLMYKPLHGNSSMTNLYTWYAQVFAIPFKIKIQYMLHVHVNIYYVIHHISLKISVKGKTQFETVHNLRHLCPPYFKDKFIFFDACISGRSQVGWNCETMSLLHAFMIYIVTHVWFPHPPQFLGQAHRFSRKSAHIAPTDNT